MWRLCIQAWCDESVLAGKASLHFECQLKLVVFRSLCSVNYWDDEGVVREVQTKQVAWTGCKADMIAYWCY